jgi:hypothetical protein
MNVNPAVVILLNACARVLVEVLVRLLLIHKTVEEEAEPIRQFLFRLTYLGLAR